MTVKPSSSELLTVKELPFPRTTVWRLMKSGKLSYYRIGRRLYFSPSHVAELLKNCERYKDEISKQGDKLA